MDEKTLKALVTAICAASAVAVVVLILDMGIKRDLLRLAETTRDGLDTLSAGIGWRNDEASGAPGMGVSRGVRAGSGVDLHAGVAPEMVADASPSEGGSVDAGPYGRFDPSAGGDSE